METEIDLEKREENIDHILHIVKVDETVCKKFDDEGCLYLNYQRGRMYRRNNIFYYIDYTSEFIYMFDENMDQMKEESHWSDHWCHNCQQHYQEDTGNNKYYLISQIMNNDKPLREIFHENIYSPRDI
tara:strand:- start:1591 stop:1974 length:384 start_codon:yes stop_codon:yes gene_type:complete